MKPATVFKAVLLSSLCCGAAWAQQPPTPDPQRDREAILAMQGEYTVGFMFDETVLLAEGYERMEPQRSGGDEVVIVIEDTPTKIVLQHILVHQPTGHVTKHWRQDWIYEAPQRWEFAPAYAYWDATAGYWARVRARWDALLSQPPGVRLKTEVDGMALIMPLFEQAGRVEQGGQVDDAELDAAFDEWTAPAPAEP